MAKKESPVNLRNIILLLLLIGFTLLVVTRFASFHQLVTGLLEGSLLWVLAAVLVHIVFFYMYAILYHFSFRVVDINFKAIRLFSVLLAGLFINAVAPTGGAGGAALFVAYGSSKRKSGSQVAVGVLVTLIADLITLIPFIIVGIVFLWSQHHATFYEWLGMLFFMIFIVGLASILLVAHRKPGWVKWLFRKIRRIINWAGGIVHKPELIEADWVEKNANEFINGSKLIAKHPKQVALALGWALIMHFVNMGGLYLFFLAYHQPVRLGTLFATFSLGIVFFVITIIPQGVGAVEGIMSLVMIAMGVPKTKAAVISLAFRGINFWVPVLAGFIIYNIMFSGFHISGNHEQEGKGEDSASADEKEPGHENFNRQSDI